MYDKLISTIAFKNKLQDDFLTRVNRDALTIVKLSNDTQTDRLSSRTWKRRERSNVDDSVYSAIYTD